MSSEFWAAIVGAIVGGAIAALLQLVSLRAASKERRAAQLQTSQTHARSLIVKLVKIYSDFVSIHGHFEECRSNAEQKGLEHGWASVIPLANLPRAVQFTSDELATLAAVRDDEVFNEVLSMDEFHNGIVEALETYRAKRMALADRLPALMSGTVGTITLTPEQHQEFAPKAAELDVLAKELEALLATEVDPKFSVVSRAANKLNLAYSMKLQVIPKLEQEQSADNAGTASKDVS